MNGDSFGADLGTGQAEEVAREAGNPQVASAAPVSRESRNQSARSDHRTEDRVIPCGIRDAQKGKTCEPFDDPRSHDFQGWVEFDEGRGGTTVCTRCGISAFSHSMRYGP